MRSKVTELLESYQRNYSTILEQLNMELVDKIMGDFIYSQYPDTKIYQCHVVLQNPPVIRINYTFNIAEVPYIDELCLPQVFIQLSNKRVVAYQIWNIPSATLETILSKVTSASTVKVNYSQITTCSPLFVQI